MLSTQRRRHLVRDVPWHFLRPRETTLEQLARSTKEVCADPIYHCVVIAIGLVAMAA